MKIMKVDFNKLYIFISILKFEILKIEALKNKIIQKFQISIFYFINFMIFFPVLNFFPFK